MLPERAQATRPVQVTRSLILLWLNLGVGILAIAPALLEPAKGKLPIPTWWRWLAPPLVIGFPALLIYSIGRRKNWARITTLVLYLPLVVAGIVATLADPPALAGRQPFVLALDALWLIALYWLFTGAGAVWFRNR